jgi:hypothetical protein
LVILILRIGVFLVRRLQPIIIITIIIIIVLMYSYFVYISIIGYWFSYILVIVILRGVLVIFTYIIRLIPNELFENYNIIYIYIFLIMRIISYEYILNEINELISLIIWISWYGILNIFIVSFLFIAILIIVWLRYRNEGAIRVSY